MSSSEFSMTCHTRSKRRRTSISSASMFSSLSRCSAATPSISSSISLTRSRMLLSVRMFARICMDEKQSTPKTPLLVGRGTGCSRRRRRRDSQCAVISGAESPA